MEILFSSARRFKVWRYSVSHSVLLLRSPRNEASSTRVDVVFQQVARMQLDAAFDGLAIGKAGPIERAELETRLGRAFPVELDVFLVGEGLDNYVLSGPPAWHEDEGRYRDPSFFESILML